MKKINPLRGKNEFSISTDRPQRYVKDALLSSTEASLLYEIPRLLGGGNIANLGHRNGGSAFVMALSLEDHGLPGTVLSMDVQIRPEWEADLARRNKTELGDRIRFTLKTTHEVGEICRAAGNTFRFVFVDASHLYRNALDDVKTWSPLVEVGGMIALHDCHDGRVNRVAEEELAGDPNWKERKELHINKIRVFERENK